MMYAVILVEVVAALLLVWKAVEAFTRMSRCTRWPYAAAWASLGGAAATTVAAALEGSLVADWRTALVLAAVAVEVCVDRRWGGGASLPAVFRRGGRGQ